MELGEPGCREGHALVVELEELGHLVRGRVRVKVRVGVGVRVRVRVRVRVARAPGGCRLARREPVPEAALPQPAGPELGLGRGLGLGLGFGSGFG